jgi:hypothetical protein
MPPAPERPTARWTLPLALATLGAGALLVLLARRLPGLGPIWLEGAIAAGLAAAAAWTAAWTGKLAWGICAAGSAFLSAYAASGAGLEVAIGLKCVALELLAASIPLATALLLVRGGSLSASWALFAGVSAAGALAGHAALHLACPVRTAAPHLFVFHTGGVLLAVLLGLSAWRLRRLRRRV